ncbi:MAG: lytic murein transglycosylase [Deltaproteobacteria bacterium]|jgi:membrane-bound lytic murein transglycosylase B|nr:lytic murein transglycosylase [Deltaproteobacteria bacterium]
MQRILVGVLFCLALLAPLGCPGEEPPADVPGGQAACLDPRWPPLIARLAEDGMDRERMTQLFSELALPWSPVFMAAKMQELYGSRLGGDAQVKALPDGDLPLPRDYMPPAGRGFEGAKAMLVERAPLLEAVYKRYGVPPTLIAAILLLESDMGHELGVGLALHALASMAATATVEHALEGIEGYRQPHPALHREMEKSVRERSVWAYAELCALIRYCETGGIDILRVPGSVHGAIGLCQFMPGAVRAYGVDSAGTGVVDVFGLPDAAHSIGNFLKEYGFSEKLPVKKQVAVLRRYNQSDSYAALALGMSFQLAGRRPPPELDMLLGGHRKPWWPKIPPSYRLPPLGRYRIQ